MLFLNYQEVNELITMAEVIDTIEAFYREDDKSTLVPERMFINDRENTVLIKPSFYQNYYGAKLIGIAPGNVELNQPTLKGMFILNDRQTMEPLAIIDARSITALRTGAVCGLGMKYLSRKDSSVLGIIGTGEQGWSHLQAACAVRPIEEVLVYNRSEDRLKQFIERAEKEYSNLKIRRATIDELTKSADIIVATTTSENPVISDDDNIDMQGKHIAASGAFKAHMQEIPDNIIKKADRIFVDTHAAFEESLDMIKAKSFGKDENNVPTLKELVRLGDKEYNEKELTIFKSVGQSIFDIITAKLIYEKYHNNSK